MDKTLGYHDAVRDAYQPLLSESYFQDPVIAGRDARLDDHNLRSDILD